jgi:chemotaxis protein MotB
MGFFESGSAGLRRSSEDAVERLARVLKNRTEMLRIEGHTDNVPIHNAQFHSNWELSTGRAMELIRVFIVQYKMEPWRLAAAGYGEYHPIDSNQTPEGRGHNRRVDIVVLAPPAPLLSYKAGGEITQAPVEKPPEEKNTETPPSTSK